MKEIKVIGIDLAKKIFQIHAVDGRGKKVFSRSVNRKNLVDFIANLPPCLIGMEACGGSNHWGRVFSTFGHDVKLIPPQYVKPYVKTNKNDAADAEAICEAVQRPNMRFVPIKAVWQQDIQTIHRVRSQLVQTKVSLENALHGLCSEYGIVLSKTESQFFSLLSELLSPEDSRLNDSVKSALAHLNQSLREIIARIQELTKQLKKIAEEREDCKRLQGVPGVGPLTSTAMVAAVGNGSQFKSGRQMSAWTGLVPRQFSSGGKTVLLGISKRGDSYLRSLLIHGARSALRYADDENPSRVNQWVLEKKRNRGVNRAAVALANKNVRAMWVLLTRGETYRHSYAV